MRRPGLPSVAGDRPLALVDHEHGGRAGALARCRALMRKKHVPRSTSAISPSRRRVEVAAASSRARRRARRPTPGRRARTAACGSGARGARRREPRRRRLAVERHAEALAGDAVAGGAQPLLDVVGRRGVARRAGGAGAAVLGRDVLERAQMARRGRGAAAWRPAARVSASRVATVTRNATKTIPNTASDHRSTRTTGRRMPRPRRICVSSALMRSRTVSLVVAVGLAAGPPAASAQTPRCPRRPPICRRRCSSRPPTRCPGGPPSTRRPGRRCCSRGSCWPVRRRPATSRARRAGRGGPEPVRPRRVARTGYRVAARRACRSAARRRSARTRVRPRGACARGR